MHSCLNKCCLALVPESDLRPSKNPSNHLTFQGPEITVNIDFVSKLEGYIYMSAGALGWTVFILVIHCRKRSRLPSHKMFEVLTPLRDDLL